MARKEIFNPRRHRLLRKQIPLGENAVSLALGLVLVAVIAWVWSTGDDIDPSRRDLPVALLEGDRPKIHIYNLPLRRWVEPGSTAPTAPMVDLGLFPVSLIADGWSLVGRVRKFDASNLYEKINGEAEKFLKQGFVAMHYAVVQAPPGGEGESARDELAVELYDQGAVPGSIGIFAAHGAAGRRTEARGGVTFFTTSIGVIGRVGRYFFRAAGTSSSERIQEKSVRLVRSFSALAGPQRVAKTVQTAPNPGAVPVPKSPGQVVTEGASKSTGPDTPEGMRILLDALGVEESAIGFKAENAFQLDFATKFWFARLAEVADSPDAQAFVRVGESATETEVVLAKLIVEQRNDFEEVDSPSRAWTMMRHAFLRTYFAVAKGVALELTI